MGGRASRNKGGNGERELAKLLGAYLGLDISRTPRSGAWEHAKGDLYGVPGFHVECKRQERFSVEAWYRQAEGDAKTGEIPVVIYRKNRGEWKVAISLEDFLPMMESHIKGLETT